MLCLAQQALGSTLKSTKEYLGQCFARALKRLHTVGFWASAFGVLSKTMPTGLELTWLRKQERLEMRLRHHQTAQVKFPRLLVGKVFASTPDICHIKPFET